MWNNFDFSELSKLGNQLNEVLHKAKTDIESRVDDALGIPVGAGSTEGQNGAAGTGGGEAHSPASAAFVGRPARSAFPRAGAA